MKKNKSAEQHITAETMAEKFRKDGWNEDVSFNELTIEDAEKRLEKWLEYQKDHLHWFVYLKATNEPIGFVSVEDLGNGKFGNLAACLGVDF